jgi:hypothetical protein
VSVNREDLIAFANDHASRAYRLKRRLRLSDGRAIVVQKVGSDLGIEEVSTEFGASELVAIGVRPEFDATRLGAVWNETVPAHSS